MKKTLPIGKLPADLLARILEKSPVHDPRVLLGPGIGLDCAVIEVGETLLVLKSDPITFATDAIGWYAVQVNANDIATTGAMPRWLLITLLLPETNTTPELVESIHSQLYTACQDLGVCIIGGHTEITYGLDRPIVIGTLIGEVSREQLITPRGAQIGDHLLLTKGVPIEATAILAREFGERLCQGVGAQGVQGTGITAEPISFLPSCLSEAELKQAQDFLVQPGISVLQEARIAIQAGYVHAMHDPTEGGIYTALWELAQACKHSLKVDLSAVPIPELSARICQILDIDPLAAIASGALLLAVAEDEAPRICHAIREAGISCTDFGVVISHPEPPTVWEQTAEGDLKQLPHPERDAIAILFEQMEEST